MFEIMDTAAENNGETEGQKRVISSLPAWERGGSEFFINKAIG